MVSASRYPCYTRLTAFATQRYTEEECGRRDAPCHSSPSRKSIVCTCFSATIRSIARRSVCVVLCIVSTSRRIHQHIEQVNEPLNFTCAGGLEPDIQLRWRLKDSSLLFSLPWNERGTKEDSKPSYRTTRVNTTPPQSEALKQRRRIVSKKQRRRKSEVAERNIPAPGDDSKLNFYNKIIIKT